MLKLGALLLALFILCNSTTQRRRNVCLLRLCVYYTRCVVCCLRRNEAGHGRSASRIDALFFPSPQPVKITAHALIVRAYMPNAVTSSPQAFLSIWRDFFFFQGALHCKQGRTRFRQAPLDIGRWLPETPWKLLHRRYVAASSRPLSQHPTLCRVRTT